MANEQNAGSRDNAPEGPNVDRSKANKPAPKATLDPEEIRRRRCQEGGDVLDVMGRNRPALRAVTAVPKGYDGDKPTSSGKRCPATKQYK